MVARGSRRAFVCLECQLKALRSPPISLLRASPPHRAFSVRRPTLFPSDSSTQLLQASNHSEVLAKRRDGDARPRTNRNRKFRGRDGKEFSENSVSLAAQTLGKPAEVIIIRDAKSIEPQRTEEEMELGPRDDNAEENERISGEILASLKDGQAEESQETVNNQIDKLRPIQAFPDQSALTVSQYEYARVEKLLKDGFTISQLHKYARARSDFMKLGGADEQPRGWSTWQRTLGPIAIKYLKLKSLQIVPKVKPKLIRLILENLWNIEVTGEGEHTGQLHGNVKAGDLLLLTFGRPSRLDAIGEQRSVKFGVDASKNAVRIVGKKANVLRAAQDINELRDSSIATTFDLQANLPKGTDVQSLLGSIRDEDLQAISELTSTVMTKVKETGISILGIGPSAVKDAQRAIMALVRKPTVERQLLAEAESTMGPLVFHQMPIGENLPLTLQRLPLGRWSSAISRSESKIPEIQSKSRSKEEKLLKPSLKLLRALEPICALARPVLGPVLTLENSRMHWMQETDIHISASLGHILHRAALEANVVLASKRMPKLLSDNSVFLKRVPNLSKVIPHLTLSQERPIMETVSFKLLPNWASSDSPKNVKALYRGELFPEIYVEILVKDDPESGRSARLHQIYAKVQEKHLDTMLPACATDIRFKRAVMVQADIDSVDQNQSIKDFIQQAKDQYMRFGSVENPSPISITIPKRIFQRSTGKGNKIGLHIKDHMNVHYVFASVETRQTIPFVFGEHDVTYNVVDAGKIGGSWEELLLHMPKTTGEDIEAADIKVHEKFVQAVFALVSRVDLTARGRLQPPQSKRQLETNVSRASSVHEASEIDHEGSESEDSSSETKETMILPA